MAFPESSSNAGRIGASAAQSLSGDLDDLSNGFHRVRSRLVNSSGVGYYEFRQTLTPRHGLLWVQLLTGHVVLLGLGSSLLLLRHRVIEIQFLAGLLGAALFGYTFSYLALFFHAASHYELYPKRDVNDLLANLSVGALYGYPMAKYRSTHFDHHRYLGLPEDPENGYIEALNFRFFVESLTGIRFLRLLWTQLHAKHSAKPQEPASPATSTDGHVLGWVRVVGLLLHFSVVVGGWSVGSIALPVAWIAGFVIVAPVVTAIRIVLEHQRDSLDPTADYTRVAHGAVSRTFGDGPLAQTLGGAGFNRHLLHHWDPQIPSTRLKDLERYLRNTELGPLIQARSTTYTRTFSQLFRR